MAPGILIDADAQPQWLAQTPHKSLPVGWPSRLTGSLVWNGSQFPRPSDYTISLTSNNLKEIRTALNHFYDQELDGDQVTPRVFPLPDLGPTLTDCAHEIHRGRGFVNIRGLDPAEFSNEDNAVVFLGISSYIGATRGKQDEDGNMMMHIYDVKETREAQSVRPIRYSNKASTYHTDTFCDILALQTRHNAASGGRHTIASSWTVYNQMASIRPDLVKALAEPSWHFDSRSKLIGSNCRPLLFYLEGRAIMNFAQEPLRGVKGVTRAASLPELTRLQHEALDMVEGCATANQLVLSLQPGDLTFINNHAMLHSREAFLDDEVHRRHLVRLWLRNEHLAWTLPAELQHGNARIYEPNEIDETWNIAPVPRPSFLLSERLCS